MSARAVRSNQEQIYILHHQSPHCEALSPVKKGKGKAAIGCLNGRFQNPLFLRNEAEISGTATVGFRQL